MFGNCLVKKLHQNDLFSVLRKTKGCLQTTGLICQPDKRSELLDLLTRSGLTRIMRAREMSSVFSGEAHDGEYALRRYVRIVDLQ